MASRIELKDVKTNADATRYLTESCVGAGLQASLYSYIIGIVGVPLAFRKLHMRIPLMFEYKLAFGACSMMIVSYYIGTYAKSRCEEKVRKELQQLMS